MTNLKGKKFDDFEGKTTVDISLRRLPGLWIIWKKEGLSYKMTFIKN